MNRHSNFFMLPVEWYLDPDVIDLPPGAQLLFLRVVAYCQSSGNDGVISETQLNVLARSMRRGGVAKRQLNCSVGVMERSARGNGEVVYVLASRHRWLFKVQRGASISAAQQRGSDGSSAKTQSSARPRAGKFLEKEQPPSGAVRSFSARAAPRSTGGATRPALVPDDPPAGRVETDNPPMSKTAALEMAKEQIAKRGGPTTGRDVTFSRWNPNRPIIQIPTAFGEAE